MNTRLFMFAAIFATALLVAVVGAYAWNFGAHWSDSHDKWGQFGDFVGGTLNPIFAMLAFLALLWSIALQASEFKQATQHLTDQAHLTREEAEANRRDKISRELLVVIKDIDARIAAVLATDVSTPGTTPRVTISHMASEAERLSNSDETSAAYESFLTQVATNGSIAEAATRKLLHLVEKMREFITDYSNARQGFYAPVIAYYADKVFHLLHVVHDLGGAKGDTFQFFATVADPHG